MAKENIATINKLEWAVAQSHGSCPFCQMDLSILVATQAPPTNTIRGNSERRSSRSYSDSVDGYDSVYYGRLASMGIIPSRLEPFRATDVNNGIYADISDSLGRVWYHIPNLGPKFCDAVRKYSIVANYREAHVIARKKSKESECMWIGIVGDPASYTTGSKRHLIELMLRNPGQSFDHTIRRHHGKSRSNRSSLCSKRRKRRKRRIADNTDSAVGESYGDGNSLKADGENDKEENGRTINQEFNEDSVNSSSDQEESSSLLSSTPSVLSAENSLNNMYGFSLREPSSYSPLPTPFSLVTLGQHLVNVPGQKHLHNYSLPTPSNLTLHIAHCEKGWAFDAIYQDPATFAFREPPLPSPEPGKSFSFGKNSLSPAGIAGSSIRPLSPTLALPQLPRKYSVVDLNEMLVMSEHV